MKSPLASIVHPLPRRTRAVVAAVVRLSAFLAGGLLLTVPSTARAQGSTTGAPPADATALVSAPTDDVKAPSNKPADGTQVSLSAGGQFVTGNSRLLAATVNGAVDSRWGANGFGASLLGNYGQGAPPGNAIVETAENIQGRLRYDRYVLDPVSVFLLNTGRQDRFQGIDFRYNLDPGVKYLFFNAATNALWVEAGYDFQYDINRGDTVGQVDSAGIVTTKTDVNHSARLYAGFKHAFNTEVTLSTGIEYIQSFTHTDHRWVNYDLLFAAKVGAGLAVGLGFNLRYDSDPLPSKKDLDTSTTLSLIYAFSDAAPKAAAAPCPPPSPPPPAPPTREVAPSPAPATEPPPATTSAPGSNPPAGASTPAATPAPTP